MGTGVQTPIVPDRRHELHGPWQSVAQQTNCAQKPLAHTSLLVHDHIVSRMHEWFRQIVPPVQSGSAVHDVAQRVPAASHLYGLHASSDGCAHAPVAPHVRGGE